MKFSNTAIIPLCEVIISRYDQILEQSEHAYLYNQPSNCTNINILIQYQILQTITMNRSENKAKKKRFKLAQELDP